MAEPLHPAASEHLPSFITAPGETDVLMVATAIILAVSVLLFGILFLRLHSLPERMAHRSHKLQFEIVSVIIHSCFCSKSAAKPRLKVAGARQSIVPPPPVVF